MMVLGVVQMGEVLSVLLMSEASGHLLLPLLWLVLEAGVVLTMLVLTKAVITMAALIKVTTMTTALAIVSGIGQVACSKLRRVRLMLDTVKLALLQSQS